MKKSTITVILSALVAAITAAGVVKASSPSAAGIPAPVQAGETYYRTVNLSEDTFPDLTYAAESCVDAVVFVKVTIRTNIEVDPLLKYFFGFGDGFSQERQGSGSGVIIRPDGYIVTNNHVVSGATAISVTLNNNRSYEAQLVGSDPVTDVALLKIDAEGLPSVEFADSDQLRLGEWVLAIGSPLGEQLKGTITAGIVSAKGRSMPSDRDFKIESFIQTDAAVNPGNSGGALVDKSGRLVGINTAIVSRTGSYSGYSFAIPSNIVKKIVGDLIDFGTVHRALLGIVMAAVDEKIAEELKLSSLSGVYINEVSKGGAAEKAGIRKGDVLVSIDGVRMGSMSEVQAKVNSYRPGDKIAVTVIRDGKNLDFEAVLQASAQETGTVEEDGAVVYYGAKLKEAEPAKLKALGLKSGVEIVSISSGKVLDAGGSQGFIIQFINDEAVAKPEDVLAKTKKAKSTVTVTGVTSTGRKTAFVFFKD